MKNNLFGLYSSERVKEIFDVVSNDEMESHIDVMSKLTDQLANLHL